MMETENEVEADAGAVLHESIADAARTRHMWQRMAAQSQIDTKIDGRSTTQSSGLARNTVNGHTIIQSDNGHPISGNGVLQIHHSSNYSNVTQRHTAENRQAQPPVSLHPSHHGSPGNGPPTPDETLENEKRVFMAYVLSHLDVVTSLGISVPWNIRQRYQQYVPPSNVRVELTVVGGAQVEHQSWNKGQTHGRSHSVGPVISPVEKRSGGDTNGTVNNPPFQTQNSTTGRYIKNTPANTLGNGHVQSGHNGWQKRMGRRQSQSSIDSSGVPLHKTVTSTTTPQWNGLASTDGVDTVKGGPHANGDNEGNMYKSLGESIIAKEIREYREREEELRRSRSQLGLPTLEDMLDTWKGNTNGESANGPTGRARSYDQLQGTMESADIYDSPAMRQRAESSIAKIDHLPNDSSVHRPVTIDSTIRRFTPANTQAQNGPRNAYEKCLLSRTTDSQASPPQLAALMTHNWQTVNAHRPCDKSASTPIEARIEQEMEEQRRREEELRLEREATGLYSVVGLQPSPLASSSPTHSANGSLSNRYGDKSSHECAPNGMDSQRNTSRMSIRTNGSTISPTNSSNGDQFDFYKRDKFTSVSGKGKEDKQVSADHLTENVMDCKNDWMDQMGFSATDVGQQSKAKGAQIL